MGIEAVVTDLTVCMIKLVIEGVINFISL